MPDRVKCELCLKPGANRKWAGKHWHIKCLRKARKLAIKAGKGYSSVNEIVNYVSKSIGGDDNGNNAKR